ncbi:hypothetical protein IWX50DRAFT_621263 [Phyllosticta citricarpa]
MVWLLWMCLLLLLLLLLPPHRAPTIRWLVRRRRKRIGIGMRCVGIRSRQLDHGHTHTRTPCFPPLPLPVPLHAIIPPLAFAFNSNLSSWMRKLVAFFNDSRVLMHQIHQLGNDGALAFNAAASSSSYTTPTAESLVLVTSRRRRRRRRVRRLEPIQLSQELILPRRHGRRIAILQREMACPRERREREAWRRRRWCLWVTAAGVFCP